MKPKDIAVNHVAELKTLIEQTVNMQPSVDGANDDNELEDTEPDEPEDEDEDEDSGHDKSEEDGNVHDEDPAAMEEDAPNDLPKLNAEDTTTCYKCQDGGYLQECSGCGFWICFECLNNKKKELEERPNWVCPPCEAMQNIFYEDIREHEGRLLELQKAHTQAVARYEEKRQVQGTHVFGHTSSNMNDVANSAEAVKTVNNHWNTLQSNLLELMQRMLDMIIHRQHPDGGDVFHCDSDSDSDEPEDEHDCRHQLDEEAQNLNEDLDEEDDDEEDDDEQDGDDYEE